MKSIAKLKIRMVILTTVTLGKIYERDKGQSRYLSLSFFIQHLAQGRMKYHFFHKEITDCMSFMVSEKKKKLPFHWPKQI